MTTPTPKLTPDFTTLPSWLTLTVALTHVKNDTGQRLWRGSFIVKKPCEDAFTYHGNIWGVTLAETREALADWGNANWPQLEQAATPSASPPPISLDELFS